MFKVCVFVCVQNEFPSEFLKTRIAKILLISTCEVAVLDSFFDINFCVE